ncbi:MAG: DUF89 family protein [Deltaproteobacteria bacterium]|nr:DUF89 family protein [Deltaproteobacteria bacterium]
MKIFLDCIPCFLMQALDACRIATVDPVVHERIIRRVLHGLGDIPFDDSPPQMGAIIHRIVREETGHPDPYHPVKARFNRLAQGLLPILRNKIESCDDPFAAAVRVAVSGNIIDFAQGTGLDESEVETAIDDSLSQVFDIDHLARLEAALDGASSILYLGDNAGEIVLDRLLLQQLPKDIVTFVVRGAPVINDATIEDAEAAGLTELVEVIDNGSDIPGTVLEECSPAFVKRFQEADIVISKGQGNYETLSDAGREVFHLLKVKCPVIARDIGCPVGSRVVLQKKPNSFRTTERGPGR